MRAVNTGPIAASALIEKLISRSRAGGQGGAQNSDRQHTNAQNTLHKKKALFPPIVPEDGSLTVGRFLAHGPGSRPPNLGQASYFIDLLIEEGRKIRLWGTDLKRAIHESDTNPKLHTIIGVQRIGYQLVKVPTKHKSADSEGPTQQALQAEIFKRGRWRVERITWFAEQALQSRRARDRLIDDRAPIAPPRPSQPSDASQRTPPEAARRPTAQERGLAIATRFAERYIHNPADRANFLQRIALDLNSPHSIFAPPPNPRRDPEPHTR